MKTNYKNFNSAAEGALDSLVAEASTTLTDPNKFDPIETYLSRWVTSLQRGQYEPDDLELATMVISHAGVQAIKWLEENHGPFNKKEMVDIVCRKQHDYGHKNITNFGTIGVGIRVCDKIARIKNLTKIGEPEVHNESLKDSYVDIVGYSMIALMLQNDSFHLQLKEKA